MKVLLLTGEYVRGVRLPHNHCKSCALFTAYGRVYLATPESLMVDDGTGFEEETLSIT